MDIKVGIITNYFKKIGVAVLKVEGTSLKIGDDLRVEGRESELFQKISSMQIEHKNIDEALPGENIGLKVLEPVKKGDVVFKVIDNK
ncbi:MAG: hypothetical protein DDT40_00469 [candidate division WS2 bacterium]|uniref:Translation elongation factor-like protein n=1 Tax=Psychracetigena formicireducens TaxID=2986056 RepID=A0A9E2F1W0_PSYF1|nr:hypothetical protein [Candidatus Psychracetigena formicireducens]MBT9145077.1 hypothetical protein [Candidatus Psychracetigena formicireducens]MBT9150301.1 hypothetical protein [Candidatus Psychracetigena formicireducens]